MSTVAQLLDGRITPGVYAFAGTIPAPGIARAARDAGWAFAHIGPSSERSELLDHIAKTLHFPAYFGHNLDALADCLRDLDQPTVLTWDRPDDPAVLAVLRARTAEADRPKFAVLVRDAPTLHGLKTLT